MAFRLLAVQVAFCVISRATESLRLLISLAAILLLLKRFNFNDPCKHCENGFSFLGEIAADQCTTSLNVGENAETSKIYGKDPSVAGEASLLEKLMDRADINGWMICSVFCGVLVDSAIRVRLLFETVRNPL